MKQKSENVILVSLALSCPLIPQLTINHARFKSLKPDTNKKNKKDKNALFVFRFSTPINQMLSDLIFLQQMRKMTTSGFLKFHKNIKKSDQLFRKHRFDRNRKQLFNYVYNQPISHKQNSQADTERKREKENW
jgi:hypothetical protein